MWSPVKPQGFHGPLCPCAGSSVGTAADIAVAVLFSQTVAPGSPELAPGPSYAAIILIGIYSISFDFGWGPIGWLVPSEVHDLNTRSAGQSITVFTQLISGAIVTQVFLVRPPVPAAAEAEALPLRSVLQDRVAWSAGAQPPAGQPQLRIHEHLSEHLCCTQPVGCSKLSQHTHCRSCMCWSCFSRQTCPPLPLRTCPIFPHCVYPAHTDAVGLNTAVLCRK